MKRNRPLFYSAHTGALWVHVSLTFFSFCTWDFYKRLPILFPSLSLPKSSHKCGRKQPRVRTDPYLTNCMLTCNWTKNDCNKWVPFTTTSLGTFFLITKMYGNALLTSKRAAKPFIHWIYWRWHISKQNHWLRLYMTASFLLELYTNNSFRNVILKSTKFSFLYYWMGILREDSRK